MAVTDNYSLYLPTVGGDTGTWGGLQNNGIFSPLDTILGAKLPVAITVADVNLSTTQFQNAIFVLSGVLTGNRSLVVPLSPNSLTVACGGRFVVVNNTTGSFNVTVKTAAGGSVGVVVPQGFTGFLYSDGTNVGFTSNGLPGYAQSVNGDPNGTLGGTAGSVNTNASLAYDYANNLLYVCTTSGAAGVAVWSAPAVSRLVQWVTGGRPVAPAAGAIGFNTTLSLEEYWTGTSGRWAQPSLAPPPSASFSNLAIKVASNTTITVAADAVVVSNGSDYQTVVPNHTINMATTGPNGLDFGAIAAATWYAVFEIAKPDGTIAALASLSATAPTMPAGYTYKARIGWVRTAAAVAQLLGTWQLGRRAQYKVGLAQTTTAVNMVKTVGAVGSITVPTWTSLSISSFVPPTASVIHFTGLVQPGGGGNSQIIAAPNSSYGGVNSTTNPPPFTVAGAGSTNGSPTTPASFILEATTIQYAATAINSCLYCTGWEDNF